MKNEVKEAMKQMRESKEMSAVAADMVGDSKPRMLILVGALIGSMENLLRLLRAAGSEEEGYGVLREDVKKIVYKD